MSRLADSITTDTAPHVDKLSTVQLKTLKMAVSTTAKIQIVYVERDRESTIAGRQHTGNAANVYSSLGISCGLRNNRLTQPNAQGQMNANSNTRDQRSIHEKPQSTAPRVTTHRSFLTTTGCVGCASSKSRQQKNSHSQLPQSFHITEHIKYTSSSVQLSTTSRIMLNPE